VRGGNALGVAYQTSSRQDGTKQMGNWVPAKCPGVPSLVLRVLLQIAQSMRERLHAVT
jgi:hypothetical protein